MKNKEICANAKQAILMIKENINLYIERINYKGEAINIEKFQEKLNRGDFDPKNEGKTKNEKKFL